MRSPLSATQRAWFPLSAALLLAGCGATTPEAPPRPSETFVRTEGARFERGALSNDDGLSALWWSELAFADGELRLSGFTGCGRMRQVEIDPPGGALRRVTVLAEITDPPYCEDEVRLRPGPDWSRATIGVPNSPIDEPDPERAPREPALIEAASLLPDRRTILVRYMWGECAGLASRRATLDGDRIRLSLMLGPRPDDPDECDLGGTVTHTLLRLPEPAPPGARIVR